MRGHCKAVAWRQEDTAACDFLAESARILTGEQPWKRCHSAARPHPTENVVELREEAIQPRQARLRGQRKKDQQRLRSSRRDLHFIGPHTLHLRDRFAKRRRACSGRITHLGIENALALLGACQLEQLAQCPARPRAGGQVICHRWVSKLVLAEPFIQKKARKFHESPPFGKG